MKNDLLLFFSTIYFVFFFSMHLGRMLSWVQDQIWAGDLIGGAL